MADADGIVLEAMLDDVLTMDVLEEAVDAALREVLGDTGTGRRASLEREIAKASADCARWVAAIGAGGELQGLVEALKKAEQRKAALTSELGAVEAQGPTRRDAGRIRAELLELGAAWRQVLAEDPERARPILAQLLIGRVRFTPLEERGRWRLHGEGTLAGLFSREVFHSVWRP